MRDAPSSDRTGSGASRVSGLSRVRPVPRRSLPVDTVEMARWLVGKLVVRETPEGRLTGRIVETEAYPVGDSTSYAFRGPTSHNAPLFGRRGHAHIQLVYGVCHTLNVSSEREGIGAGVLIRAVEPIEGIDLMERRRPGVRRVDLARGPGRLALAMDIGARFHGIDLCDDDELWLGALSGYVANVGVTTRIGLSREMHRKLRFYERGSAFVSGPRSLLEPARRRVTDLP
jgi:DNA-3-methyladenine glycosylase